MNVMLSKRLEDNVLSIYAKVSELIAACPDDLTDFKRLVMSTRINAVSTVLMGAINITGSHTADKR